MEYIVITKEFAEAMQGKKGIESYFGYAITNDGRYVCAFNTTNDFPNDFTGEISTVELSVNDFPAPINILK